MGSRELLLAEIVGNRARLALARASVDGAFELIDDMRFERGEPRNFEEKLAEFLARAPAGERLAAIAVGGPVEGQHARLTRDSFVISARQLQRQHGFTRVLLKNDFVALALGAVHCPPGAFVNLIPGGGDPTSSTVIVGPNAGLGMATIRQTGTHWEAFESEGGHQSFSPADLDEMALWREMLPGSQYVTYEDVISEQGVLAAYRVFTRLSGGTPSLQSFQAVVEAADAKTSQAAVQACAVVARSLATFAGNACLAVGARGGVIIAGTVARALEHYMADPSFAQRFHRRGPMTLYVADIPVRLLRDDSAVLRGLAAHALHDAPA
jgi:glucokinase